MTALHEARDLMSKAFVKEQDSEAVLPYEPPAIPAGIKNYMTPQGHRHMQDELHNLLRVRLKVVETVAWAAENGDRSENGDYIYGKHRLREIDRRVRFLSTRLESAEVVDPKQQKTLDQVFFGATVTYADGRVWGRTDRGAQDSLRRRSWRERIDWLLSIIDPHEGHRIAQRSFGSRACRGATETGDDHNRPKLQRIGSQPSTRRLGDPS
jgi:transcription elongation factor GreB